MVTASGGLWACPPVEPVLDAAGDPIANQPTPSLKKVTALQGLAVSRVAASGECTLAFVETCITRVAPSCAPLRGGTTLRLFGAGFYKGSMAPVLRFAMVGSGQQVLVRGEYVERPAPTDANPELTERYVSAAAPPFPAAGDVAVQLSFNGTDFTVAATLRYYVEPSLSAVTPAAAPIAGGTSLSVSAADASTLLRVRLLRRSLRLRQRS